MSNCVRRLDFVEGELWQPKRESGLLLRWNALSVARIPTSEHQAFRAIQRQRTAETLLQD